MFKFSNILDLPSELIIIGWAFQHEVNILSGGIGFKIPELFNSAVGLKAADESLESAVATRSQPLQLESVETTVSCRFSK